MQSGRFAVFCSCVRLLYFCVSCVVFCLFSTLILLVGSIDLLKLSPIYSCTVLVETLKAWLSSEQVPVSRDQQVFVGGVSDGQLQRGDVITAIEHYDATNIPHRQAEDIIRAAHDTLSVSVRRSVSWSPRSLICTSMSHLCL